MAVVDEIRQRVTESLKPSVLEIEDQSERHRGHAGYREGGQTHFHLHIKAASLGEMSRIERHRAVHTAIGPDLIERIHALSLSFAE